MQDQDDERGSGTRTQRAVGSGELERARDALRTVRERSARPLPSQSGGVEDVRVEVERRMARGARFSDVEDVINSSALSADEKSALWLLGWSYVDWRAQRREARAHLALFARGGTSATACRRRTLRIVD